MAENWDKSARSRSDGAVTRGSGEQEPGTFERTCAALSLVVPLVITLLRAGSSSGWRDDLPAVTGFAFLPLGGEGWLGIVADQLFSFLPVGGRWLRAAWAASFALALASRLIYDRARALLARSDRMPALNPALALAAALTAVLSPSFQLEATVVGGAALGTAAALAALAASEALPRRDARSSLLVGALVGVTAVESHAAALALFLALAARSVARRALPELRTVLAGAAGAGVVVGLVVGALFMRSVAPNAWLDLGFGLGQSSLTAGDAGSERLTALSAWLADMGLVPLALSVFGLVVGLARKTVRRALLPLVTLVLVDLALPATHVGPLAADPFAPTRLLALAALGVTAALGVQAAALGIVRARLPFARPAAVLLVAFDFTLVFVGSEASAAATERRDTYATEVWTDEGLASMPDHALLLARSESLAYRLWAAQLVRGERPDALIVPVSWLERGALRRRLIDAEPALAPLLRDIALNGRPGEYALTSLADARPLFVELEPGWDERLSDHVLPESFWLAFRSNPVARSDRTLAIEHATGRFERAVRAVTPTDGAPTDGATRAVVVSALRQRALFLAGHDDHELLSQTLERLELLAPKDPVGARLRAEEKSRPEPSHLAAK